jgi:UDP-GlcNAc3NAcA epimerase
MKILSIVGARPEFIQSAPVSKMLRTEHEEILVHTGQHYDYLMSQTFFDEIGIPKPDYNLEVGSGSHAKQTAEILVRLEEVLIHEAPDLVIIRGDTNSTLAGSLAASKLHIALAHIEAGERSFDRRMPEEINRLASDRLSDLFFCVSRTAVNHLGNEGIRSGVYWVGDVMLDAMLANLPIAREKSSALSKLGLLPKGYSLVTIHRAANTDNPERLTRILNALSQVGEQVIFPVHPRTRGVIEKLNVKVGKSLRMIEPVGYYDMAVLEENARLIATDSGGVQREAYFLKVPCLTLRDETEWMETLEAGWNRLVGADDKEIMATWWSFSPPTEQAPIFGDGKASEKIFQIVSAYPITDKGYK